MSARPSAAMRPAYRIDGASVSREAFYAAACDPRRSVAVEACAGAGKTWMLVSRILRALLDGAEPHEILAITFTRKAAGEMRTRLNQWLLAFAAPQCDDATRMDELRARGLNQADARALAPALGRLYAHVLEAGRPVEIRTFHAWFSQLLRAAPIELLTQLGLHADMEVVDDIADHRPAILQRFHAAVLADPELCTDYRTLVRDRGRAQLRKWLDAAWDKRIEIELADAAGTLEASVAPASMRGLEHGVPSHPTEHMCSPPVDAMLHAAAVAMARQKGAVCRRQGALLELALSIADPVLRFQEARAALFTAEGKRRQHIDAPGVAEALELLEEIGRACQQQNAHDEHLRMVRLARVLLREAAGYKRSRGLADMADLERCALALLCDAELAGWVQQRLDTRIRHLLIDEFQDTSPLQWHALHAWLSAYAGAGGGASGQRPPGVFIVGDPKQSIYRFRRAEPRVFDAACEFIALGLDGRLLACDHTRRNAPEVLGAINAVFEEAQRLGEFSGFRVHTTEHGAVGGGGDGAGVGGGVGGAASVAAGAGASTGAGAGVFMLPRMSRPDPLESGEKSIDPDEWRDSLTRARVEAERRVREPEARQIAAAVRELIVRDGYAPGEIYVLCRKRESLRLVADCIAALHLPCAAAEDLPLLESIEAKDLVAVLDVLASPRHTLSLAHALRSPLFGANDDDLMALAEAAAPHGDWWRVLMQAGAVSPPERPEDECFPAERAFSGTFRAHAVSMSPLLLSPPLRRAAQLLARWHAAARILPPHDLLDRIVHEGEFRERVAAAVPRERCAAALGAIDALLGLALTLDGARYATPYNFVRALKRRAVNVAAPVQRDAVQLLTVHGAKGLEARAVFVMDADPEHKGAESATLLVDWPVESAFPLHCAFVYSEVNCPPSLEGARDREFAARRREELNGLYVAMSRARERLVFSATEPHRKTAERSWWQRLEGRAELLPSEGMSGASNASEAEPLTLWSLPRWNGAMRSPLVAARVAEMSDAADADADADADAADADDAVSRLGQAVHRVLEWAAGPQPGSSSPDLPALAAAAAREFGVPANEVARPAARIWNSPACARFFSGAALRWAGNEVTVADAGEPLRIDRLVAIEEGGAWVWWVLDYKLQHAPQSLDRYCEQLLRYRRAVRALQPGEVVRCAFVTGEGAVVEIDSAAATTTVQAGVALAAGGQNAN